MGFSSVGECLKLLEKSAILGFLLHLMRCSSNWAKIGFPKCLGVAAISRASRTHYLLHTLRREDKPEVTIMSNRASRMQASTVPRCAKNSIR